MLKLVLRGGKQENPAEGGFQRSLGESLAPRGRDVLGLQQSLRTAPSVLGLMHTRDAIPLRSRDDDSGDSTVTMLA